MMYPIYFKLTTEPYTTKCYTYHKDMLMTEMMEHATNRIYDDFDIHVEEYKFQMVDTVSTNVRLPPEDGPVFIPRQNETIDEYHLRNNLSGSLAFYIRLIPQTE